MNGLTSRVPVVRTANALRARMSDYAEARHRTVLVPTMGALHEGHLSLVRIAKRLGDRVIVSIYVNPTQFAPGEDFDAYPRDTAADLDKLASEGVDLVYTPDAHSMYATDHSTRIIVGGVGDGLETDHRPTFFHGVALVVLKLFNRVGPDLAVFGEKDYQQLAVIRRMVRDLDLPVEIVGAPIARDAQGLALSSRNRYFDEKQIETARRLNAVMFAARDRLEAGEPSGTVLADAQSALGEAGFDTVDYVSLAGAASLALHDGGTVSTPQRLLVAAHCHGVRLIDNCAVQPPEDNS
ncbi:MAG: pantoate--beta-alanine ligase [Pseudomonadota bacterium]